MQILATRIIELREEKGLSQKQAAQALFISNTSLSNYELNISTPSPETLVEICNLYNVSMDFLFGIKNPLLKQRIEKRMQECEILLGDLEKLKAQLILERGQKLSESDIISFVKIILQGDINDFEFKRRLIDNLVYKVYVSDDNTYIYFNIKGGNNIEEITLEDTKTALKNSKKVQTQSDLARHW